MDENWSAEDAAAKVAMDNERELEKFDRETEAKK